MVGDRPPFLSRRPLASARPKYCWTWRGRSFTSRTFLKAGARRFSTISAYLSYVRIATLDRMCSNQRGCFTLTVNNTLFLNASSEFLLAQRVGFPYPQSREAREDGLLLAHMTGGMEQHTLPLSSGPHTAGGRSLWQPMIPWTMFKALHSRASREAHEMVDIYDTTFVRDNCPAEADKCIGEEQRPEVPRGCSRSCESHTLQGRPGQEQTLGRNSCHGRVQDDDAGDIPEVETGADQTTLAEGNAEIAYHRVAQRSQGTMAIATRNWLG